MQMQVIYSFFFFLGIDMYEKSSNNAIEHFLSRIHYLLLPTPQCFHKAYAKKLDSTTSTNFVPKQWM